MTVIKDNDSERLARADRFIDKLAEEPDRRLQEGRRESEAPERSRRSAPRTKSKSAASAVSNDKAGRRSSAPKATGNKTRRG